MPPDHSGAAIRVGEWIVDPALDTISRAGETQKLEPRTMRLLVCLAEAAGAVVSIDRLLDEVWTGVVVSSASVYQAVSQLRKTLGDTGPTPTYIATVPRKGYRVIADVAPVTEQFPPVAASVPAVMTTAIASAPAIPPKHRAFRWPPRTTTLGIALVALAALASLAVRLLPRAEANVASIAVLPFVDMTAEKSDRPFCDGLTEELSNWLAQIPSLRVVSRTSAFAFRERSVDVRAIGKALDTNQILEGSLRRSGDHMRVTVQLIDARSGYHLWSATYDRAVADTINLQEDISRSVADSLAIRLTPDTAARFAARRSTNPQAYQAYLLARHYQQERTAQANDRAIELYRQALLADPRFALADVGLAYALLNENWLGDRRISDIAAEAEPLLDAALRLDARLSDLYAVRGALRAEQFRGDAALQDFGRAVQMNPNDSVAYAELGRLFLITKGQPRDALLNYTHAAALDPVNSQPQAQRCVALQDLGEFDAAADACARARALQPKAYWPLTVTSWLAAAQGRIDDALHWNQQALTAAPDVFHLYIERSQLLLTLGLPAAARAALERARVATTDGEAVDDALAQVAYYEGGARALRAHLDTTRLAESTQAQRLIRVAYDRLLIGEDAAAAEAIARAFKAPDFIPESLDSPWEAARWGHSDQLTVALVELRHGNQASAMRRLDAVSATLDRLVSNGDKRFSIDEMRAAVLALRGDGEGAVRALNRAADHGWRGSWWAAREPDVAPLRDRSDFRAVLARVDQANARLREAFLK